MAYKKAKRERGRVLTDVGWNKLDTALQAWEVLPGNKRSFEKMALETQLDPGTIAKIMKRREGADLTKIEQVFRAFKLSVEVEDHAVLQEAAQTADPNFVGREGAIADLQALVDRHTKVIVIQARGGVGKTTLARKYLQQEFGTFLEFPIAKETKDIASVESLIEEKLRQLGEEPGREFLVSIDRLKRKLQSERIGILIDNLEPALDSAGKLIEAHRRYVELLRVLADPTVRSLTLITTRERLREPSITVQHYLLRSLDVTAWESYFQARNIGTEGEALAALHNAYGGNAKAMDILSGAIAEDFAGDMAAYWRVNQDDLLIERDLEDLVTTQFERIRELDGDAYNLLCRMGCYRYQDVPRVPIEGLLCLLWDVAEGQRRRVVKALQDRSLVDCVEGEYWLHPVIRGEAIGRLRKWEDWEVSNRKAAEFWTVNVKAVETLEDVLRAFEAYYHYLGIKDFQKAGSVILYDRISTYSVRERLGRSFYKLGLYQQLIYRINSIISNIDSNYYLSGLYDILGVPYRVIGEIHKAIELHEEARNIANEFLQEFQDSNDIKQAHIKAWSAHSLLNIGICKIYLWELEEAREIFTNIESSHEDSPYVLPAKIFLAFLYSSFGVRKEAFRLIGRIENESLVTGYRSVFIGLTYKNLGEYEKSFRAYQQAIQSADESSYVSVKVKALCGLAELSRLQSDLQASLLNGLEALEILREIDDKTELSEVWHQLGLTYQAIGETEKSNKCFQEAVQLFKKMEAPKQVERVRRSMENQA
jgi:tetratricopeptide (TPR) repeat protein